MHIQARRDLWTRKGSPRRAGALLALALAAFSPACERRSLPGVVVEEVANPTAPGSGEVSLAALPDGRTAMSWIEPVGGQDHAVRVALRDKSSWSDPRTVAQGSEFFVNWADFPTVAALGDGTLFAHWLERNAAGRYTYVVKVARSVDEGRTWGEAFVPHTDRSAAEHGFVSMADDGAGRMALVWLDGRDKAGTALLSTRVGRAGPVAEEERVDGRVCDCCQTALVRTPRGLLAAFRDRSEDEVRDIAVARHANGAWSPSRVVAADGWKIDGCPVNGPALAVDGDRVALAWFTLEPAPSVRLAFSGDGGETWGPARPLHEGRPLGRVDVAFLAGPGGDAVVSFLEQAAARPAADPESAAGPARLVLRRVDAQGRVAPLVEAAPTIGARSSGFPRLERAGDGLLLAWRDAGEPARVRTALVRAGGS